MRNVMITFLLVMTTFSSLQGQQNQTLYFMKIPQARFMNPAFQGECNFYLGFPGINSSYVGINNNSIGFNDIIFPGTGPQSDSLITFLHPSYDVDNFLNKLKPVNQISPEIQLTEFSMGFWSGESYISVDISEKFNSYLTFPDDLVILALKGNTAFAGSSVNLDPLAFSVMYHREFAFGYSREFIDGLVIGLRAKVLFGIADLSMNNRQLNVEVDQNNLYAHTINADVAFNTSNLPFEFQKDSLGYLESIEDKDIDFTGTFLNFSNPGAGIDIGATYDINNRFTVSASVIDIGFIRWKSEVANLTSQGSFLFQGIDVTPLFDAYNPGDFDEIADNLLDSLSNTFKPLVSNNPYTVWLPLKVYLGGVFHLTEKVHFGLLSKTTFQKGKIWQSITASANAEAGKWLTASLSYSLINGTYNNFGLGLGIRGGPIQLYFVTDKIIYNFAKYEVSGENTLLLPDNISSLNFRFGLNLVFGCRSKMLTDRPLFQ